MINIVNNDSRLQSIALYTYQFDVKVKATTAVPVWEQSLVLEDIVKKPSIAALRELYLQLGKQPSRYRSSVEALMRRIAQQKGLYAINNVVDAGNLLSLELECPIGIYDAKQIQGDVHLKIGSDEPYETIGKGMFNIASLPTLYDAIGPFGNPNSDSKRTMIREQTESIYVVIYGFQNTKVFKQKVEDAINLFQQRIVD